MSSAYNTLTLSAPAPAGTFAVRVVRPATSQGFAMTLEAPDQVAFTFSPQAGRCQPNPPGQLLSAHVDVDISFLDRFGRESPTRRVSVR
jgi:hypothetical protein